jgi:hypothetical protein
MNDGKDKKRLFIGRVSDEKTAYPHESHRPGGQVGSVVALVGKGLVGKGNERLNGFVNLLAHSVGCIQIVFARCIPKARRGRCTPRGAEYSHSCAAVVPCFAFLPQSSKCFFTVDGLHSAALDVVIAAVEHFPVSVQARPDSQAWRPGQTRLSRVRFRLQAGLAVPEFRVKIELPYPQPRNNA